jgi:hypothetical protein
MTTNFGTSTFNGAQGGYQLSPQLQSIQQRLFAQTGAYDPTQVAQAAQPLYGGAQSLFGLGQQILPSQYNTASSQQAQALASQYQQAMQGLLPSSYQSAVSPEAQAAAQQYQQYSSMLAPTSLQTGASPQAQAYAQQLQGLSSQLIPSSFQSQASPQAQAYAQQLQGLSSQLIPSSLQAQASPEAQAYTQQLQNLSSQFAPTTIATSASPEAQALAQQFQQTGAGYLSQTPEQARAEYMRTQQAALAPGRAAEEARLATANYGRGTGGLGVQTGTGTAPSNPLAQALFNARGQQDLQLATQAEQAALDRQAQLQAARSGGGSAVAAARIQADAARDVAAMEGINRYTQPRQQSPGSALAQGLGTGAGAAATRWATS